MKYSFQMKVIPLNLAFLFLVLGIPPLLNMLTSEYAIIQQMALESLTQITLDGKKNTF